MQGLKQLLVFILGALCCHADKKFAIYRSSTYYLYGNLMTFKDAQAFCQKNVGGNLASFSNSGEWSAVIGNWVGTDPTMDRSWFGLTDDASLAPKVSWLHWVRVHRLAWYIARRLSMLACANTVVILMETVLPVMLLIRPFRHNSKQYVQKPACNNRCVVIPCLQAIEGTYAWSDGATLGSWSKWKNGDAPTSNVNNCVLVDLASDAQDAEGVFWDTDRCSRLFQFICEVTK